MKKYWYVPIILILLLLYIFNPFSATDKIIRDLKIKTDFLKKNVEKYQEILAKKIGENNILLEQKISIEKKLKKELNKPIKIKWKTKYKIKEIEKIKYITLNDCYEEINAFRERLKKQFGLYLETGNTIEDNIKNIIKNFNDIIEQKDKIIDEQYSAILKLSRKAKRKFSLVFGITYSVSFNNINNFGIGLTFGYRVL